MNIFFIRITDTTLESTQLKDSMFLAKLLLCSLLQMKEIKLTLWHDHCIHASIDQKLNLLVWHAWGLNSDSKSGNTAWVIPPHFFFFKERAWTQVHMSWGREKGGRAEQKGEKDS